MFLGAQGWSLSFYIATVTRVSRLSMLFFWSAPQQSSLGYAFEPLSEAADREDKTKEILTEINIFHSMWYKITLEFTSSLYTSLKRRRIARKRVKNGFFGHCAQQVCVVAIDKAK